MNEDGLSRWVADAEEKTIIKKCSSCMLESFTGVTNVMVMLLVAKLC